MDRYRRAVRLVCICIAPGGLAACGPSGGGESQVPPVTTNASGGQGPYGSVVAFEGENLNQAAFRQIVAGSHLSSTPDQIARKVPFPARRVTIAFDEGSTESVELEPDMDGWTISGSLGRFFLAGGSLLLVEREFPVARSR